MSQFRCIYFDVKEGGSSMVEDVHAASEREAFQQFIRNRHRENWTIPEIFCRSSLKIVREDSNDRYVINAFGEIVKETEYFNIAG